MKNLHHRLIIRPSEIQELYGISRTTVHRQLNKKIFPAPFSISAGCIGWFKDDLDDHFKALSEAKNDSYYS